MLEDADTRSASSTGVLGLRWYDCVVTGMEAHAGPTPMALRKDALQVATCVMQEVDRDRATAIRRTVAAPSASCRCFPNSRNVIPGRVKFSIDLRNVDSERLDTMDDEIRAFIDEDGEGVGAQI